MRAVTYGAIRQAYCALPELPELSKDRRFMLLAKAFAVCVLIVSAYATFREWTTFKPEISSRSWRQTKGKVLKLKRFVSRRYENILGSFAATTASREKCKESALWQRRFWEHWIRDEGDYARHMDYLHLNPVKHGYVTRVCDWPYSTFYRLVSAGYYPQVGWWRTRCK